jgi:hypothetical protein
VIGTSTSFEDNKDNHVPAQGHVRWEACQSKAKWLPQELEKKNKGRIKRSESRTPKSKNFS